MRLLKRGVLDVLGWNDVLQKMDQVGPYQTAGIELKAQYRIDNVHWWYHAHEQEATG